MNSKLPATTKRSIRRKRKDFEIRFCEELLQKRPNFVQALSLLGDAYTRKGFYQEGLAVDQRLILLRPNDPIVCYNYACSLALVENVEQAFSALRRAVIFGYNDFSYMEKDPDLENVRKYKKYPGFREKIKKIIADKRGS